MSKGKPKKLVDEMLTEEILRFVREHQSIDYPNPNRKGCPPKVELLSLVNSGNLPYKDLHNHLLNCSPCFKDFQVARHAKLSAPVPAALETNNSSAKFLWRDFFLNPLPVTVSFILILMLGGIIYFFLYSTSENTVQNQTGDRSVISQENYSEDSVYDNLNAQSEENTDRTANIEPPLDKQKKTETKSNTIKKPETKLMAHHNIDLDFSDSAVLRNQDDSKENVYTLFSKIVRLHIQLPKNNPKGIYTVSLLDELGQPLTEEKKTVSNGNNLTIDFDLQDIRGRGRLCLAPKDEIPDCFAIIIRNAQ